MDQSEKDISVQENIFAPLHSENEVDINERKQLLNFTLSVEEWDNIKGNIFIIRDIVENKLSQNIIREKAFESLYTELDAFKRDKPFEDHRSLYIDLILLYDRIELNNEKCSEFNQDILQSLKEELRELLQRRDITLITNCEINFDPSYQRAISVQKVDSLDLDGKVLYIMREGFEYNGKVLRPQEVVVGRYQNIGNTCMEIVKNDDSNG